MHASFFELVIVKFVNFKFDYVQTNILLMHLPHSSCGVLMRLYSNTKVSEEGHFPNDFFRELVIIFKCIVHLVVGN